MPKMVLATLRLQDSGQLEAGAANHMDVNHDDWCDALNSVGYCNCEPEIVFKGEVIE